VTVALIIAAAILVATTLIIAFRQQSSSASSWLKQDIEALRTDLTTSLENLTAQMNDRLRDNSSLLGERLDHTTRVVNSVSEHLGRIHAASIRIFEIGKDISSLQELLRAPKMRGGIGEYFLEDILSQVMPKSEFYQSQYVFKAGQQVDAVIKLGKRLVPIDAKFPLENFRVLLAAPTDDEKRVARKQFTADVKKHISDIASKYVLPDEGTFNFALMYIPAENVYYETIIKDEKFADETGLFQFSLEKRVIPVSPNTLYAYLQVILLGLKGMAVEKDAQAILAGLDRLEGDFEKISDDFAKLGGHLSDSRKSFDNAEKKLHRAQERIVQIGSLQQEEKVLAYEQKSAL